MVEVVDVLPSVAPVVDVSVVGSVFGDGDGVLRRACDDYANEAARELQKHARYPTPELVPFVMGTGGRFGKEALAVLHHACRASTDEFWNPAMAEAHQLCSAVVARAVGLQLAGPARLAGAGTRLAHASFAGLRPA